MEQAKTAKQIKAEVERFQALGNLAKLNELEAFRSMIKAAGMYDYGRAGFYVGVQGRVHIYDAYPLSISVHFMSASDVQRETEVRLRRVTESLRTRDRIRRNADS